MSASVSRRTFLGIAGGAVSVLGLAACGGNSAASDDANAASGDADGKTYLVATDTTFAPFEFTNEAGEFVGIDVDILAAIAADQGFSYELNSLGFDAAVAALESNQADAVIAGMSITPERLLRRLLRLLRLRRGGRRRGRHEPRGPRRPEGCL